MTENYMMINGVRYPVINAWVDTEAHDGRKRWGIVTETEEQPAPPAGATVAVEQLAAGRSVDEQGTAWDEAASGPPRRLADGPGCYPVTIAPSAPALAQIPAGQPDYGTCYKCRQPFDPTDADPFGRAQQDVRTPFCRGCVSRCHDTEIADHWCPVDQWRTEGGKA